MNRRSAIRILFTAGAGSFFLPLSHADTPSKPSDPPQDFTIRSEVRLVVLDVCVKDRQGGLVPGLHRENFTVFENGVPQPVTVFANDDLPVTVGILVDESHSMAPKRVETISAAEAFIGDSNPRDEVFILNFNETVNRGLKPPLLFSDDLEELRAALNRGLPEGRTALYDAVDQGLQQLNLGQRDKKALLVISDGGDNISRHTRDQVVREIERSNATIYTIGLFDAGDPDRNPGVLKQLAGSTGGEAFFPASLEELTPLCRAIAHEIRTRYTVGYLPPASNGSDLRRVRVSVSAPGFSRLIARTRTRYRYETGGN